MSAKKKQKVRGLWTEGNMKKAIALLLKGQVPLKRAANIFDIPVATLRRRMCDLKAGKEVSFTPTMGRFKPTFSKELEEQLVSYVKSVDRESKPFRRDDFLKLAYDLACHLKLPHQFNSQLRSAGRKFYYDFVKRHPDLFPQKRDYTASKIAAEYLASLNRTESELEAPTSNDGDSEMNESNPLSVDPIDEDVESLKDVNIEPEILISSDSLSEMTESKFDSVDKDQQSLELISGTRNKETDVRPV